MWVQAFFLKHPKMKAIKTMSDEELLEAIKSGGTSRQRAIQQMYNDRQFSERIIQYVKSNSGNYQDGQDMFHEGIIVMDRNIRADKFRQETSLKGYLYSICRFLWMNQIRKQSKMTYTDDNLKMDDVEEETPEVVFESDEKKNFLRQLIHQLGERCQKTLELWKLSYSMEEIAEKMGFSSAAMARKNKYRCHKSLLKIIEDNPEITNTLKGYYHGKGV